MAQVFFDINIDMISNADLLKSLNLEYGGKTQQFFTNEIIRRSDKYVPFSTGVLKNSAHPSADFESIIYTAPYARYHWFGMLMIDPITGKGSFFDPKTARHWSRPNTQKVLTDVKMKYSEAPIRGSKWVERMWMAEGQEVIDSTQKFIERNMWK